MIDAKAAASFTGGSMSNLWKPEVFQGKGNKKNYFEGWYFKSVSKDENTAYAVITGISVDIYRSLHTKNDCFV